MRGFDVSLPDDLQRVSILLVIIGVSVLYAAGAVYTPPRVSVAAIDGQRMGEMVRVTGVVSNPVEREGTLFFTIGAGNRTVRAVAFQSGFTVHDSERYEITGRVDVYRGEPELVVHAVSRVG